MIASGRITLAMAAAVVLSGCLEHDSTCRFARVVGHSMAPALRDGDVVNWSPRVGAPGRYARVICQLEAGPQIVKRVLGFPGENLACLAGDLTADGTLLVKSPQVLAELATVVGDGTALRSRMPSGWSMADDTWHWQAANATSFDVLSVDPQQVTRQPQPYDIPVIYDDSPWLVDERRRLKPVRDAGLAAVIDVDSQQTAKVELRLRCGSRTARMVGRGSGLVAVVAGRLDGQFVAATWPLAQDLETDHLLTAWLDGTARSALPPWAPAVWQASSPVSDAPSVFPLTLAAAVLTEDGSQQNQGPSAAASLTVRRLVVWRDVHWLPPAGQSHWSVPPGQVVVLGDCPAASRDSRHWGGLPLTAIVGEVIDCPGSGTGFRLGSRTGQPLIPGPLPASGRDGQPHGGT